MDGGKKKSGANFPQNKYISSTFSNFIRYVGNNVWVVIALIVKLLMMNKAILLRLEQHYIVSFILFLDCLRLKVVIRYGLSMFILW